MKAPKVQKYWLEKQSPQIVDRMLGLPLGYEGGKKTVESLGLAQVHFTDESKSEHQAAKSRLPLAKNKTKV